MTVEELQLFANQLDTLPSKVDGRDAVTQLLKQVETFQIEAKRAMTNADIDIEDLNKIIENGSNLDVDLPELNELKLKAKRAQWLDDAKEIIDDPLSGSFDHIKSLIETGMELPPNPTVEKILGKDSGF